ncbi:CLUMA_CG015968, isoform A [Clunio marinus]|uniref:CLUMA_CG015968, isoform A n=1 Tax=Clunio marinus TaxID=568069 RepID=A0A1J1ISW1_9DIPT|nr:CLUMA_CG015968, isoform A [Clunio marinus]
MFINVIEADENDINSIKKGLSRVLVKRSTTTLGSLRDVLRNCSNILIEDEVLFNVCIKQPTNKCCFTRYVAIRNITTQQNEI